MSKKDEIASSAEQDGQSTDSVYDFLYHDGQRIGSFLAQFDNLGHLQQVSSSETASKDSKRGFSVKLAGNVPIPGNPESAEGSITLGREPFQGGSEGEVRVYDPLWSNALALLDYLDERNFIQRDVTVARLGQFVIASGELSILNAAMLPKMWANASIREAWVRKAVEDAKLKLKSKPRIADVKQSVRERAEQAALKEAETTARSGMEVLPLFPHSPQCIIKGKDFSVWSTLSVEGMVGTVADLSLKHGTEIPGEWHLLGVLDALPSPIPEQLSSEVTGAAPMANLIRNLSNIGRNILGRPAEAFGMTALLLFRKVTT
jgi:hypothetical protein